MNKEKELLLALLIEKYSSQSPASEIHTALAKKPRKRRHGAPMHNWTDSEKELLWNMRKQGYSWEQIAQHLGNGLTPKKCQSMWSNMVASARVAAL